MLSLHISSHKYRRCITEFQGINLLHTFDNTKMYKNEQNKNKQKRKQCHKPANEKEKNDIENTPLDSIQHIADEPRFQQYQNDH